jgi:diguanylate cyclase (GGDEF)-like protein
VAQDRRTGSSIHGGSNRQRWKLRVHPSERGAVSIKSFISIAADVLRTFPRGGEHPRRLIDKFKLEAVVVVLLFATAAAVFFEDSILRRTLVLGPNDTNAYLAQAHTDVAAGGTSKAITDPKRPLSWQCELRAGYQYPYCAYELQFDPQGQRRGLDLARFESLDMAVDYQGSAETLRLHLKNHDPRYSKPGVNNPHKMNAIEAPLESGKQVLSLERNDFTVADWWIQENEILPELSNPQFDNIVSLEVSTGTGAPLGRHTFQVRSITLHGRVLTQAEWYLAILLGWAALIVVFLSFRIIGTRRALRREIQARHDAEQRADLLARHDPMTGFLNARAFGSEVEARLSATRRSPVRSAIVLISVDRLRAVNETYGHLAGDELLIEVAARLKAAAGHDLLAGRIRGGDFAWLVSGEVGDLTSLAAQLVDKLNQPFPRCPANLKVVVTMGVACSPDHGAEFPQLFRAAEIALQDAKRAGRPAYRLFDPELAKASAASSDSSILPSKLLSQQDDAPSAFVLRAATDVIMKTSCRMAVAWPGETALVVDLTPGQLEDEWAADRILTLVDSSGFERSKLIIRVGEALCLQFSASVARNLQQLQQAGIKLALEAFENRVSPASSSIRFDQIAIGRTFLSSLASAGEDQVMEAFTGAARPVPARRVAKR